MEAGPDIDNPYVDTARIGPRRRPWNMRPAVPKAPAATAVGWRADLFVALLGLTLSGAFFAWLCGLPPKVAKLSDFYREAWPAYHALSHGDVLGFIRTGPAYVGSLVLRAPFALLATAVGGHSRAVAFATGLPCLAAAAAFCAWLTSKPRDGGPVTWPTRINPMLLFFISPILGGSLILGHPDEVLGAVLCVGGVVLASRGRGGWCGLLLGLAVVNKTSALVAIPVALAVAPRGVRWRALGIAAVVAGAFLVPITLIRDQTMTASGAGATLGTQTVGLFFSPQLLWWLGSRSWIVREAHPIIVLCACGCAALWWAVRARRPSDGDATTEAVQLLALVLLLRAALDPWNNIYYELGFVLALMTYEVLCGRTPLMTFAYSVAIVAIVPIAFIHMQPDLRAALFAAMAVPTIGWLSARIYLPACARVYRSVPRRRVASGARQA
jgi:hypothetical protein